MKKLNMARITAGFIIAVTLINPATQTYAAETKKEITVDIDGKYLSFDQPPILENGKVLVPMRAIFEALGATVEWLPKEQSIEAIKQTGTSRLKCYISLPDNLMYINYAEYDGYLEGTQTPKDQRSMFFYSNFDVPPKIVNGKTLVPARAVAEAFGATVTWDGNAQAVHISMVNAKIVDPKTGKSLDVKPNDMIPTPTPKPTEPAKADEPFNLKVGDIAGNILIDPSDTTTKGVARFTKPYATASVGQCAWYARGRFYEMHGIEMPLGLGSAKEWLSNATKSDQLIIITDLNDIRDKTIAVYTPTTDQNHPGHVTFIEHVERDENGNPTYVYFTEANGRNDLNKNQYDHGYDGIVQKETFETFKSPYTLELIGYIAPK